MNKLQFYSLKLIKESKAPYLANNVINSPQDGFNFLHDIVKLHENAEEYLYMIALGTKNNILGVAEVSHGSINSSIVTPREVFKRAFLMNATGIIIAHNHPSGNPQPSKEDIDITLRLNECSKILGVGLLDHIIIGENRFISLKDKGTI